MTSGVENNLIVYEIKELTISTTIIQHNILNTKKILTYYMH